MSMFLFLANQSARKSLKPDDPDGEYASDLETGGGVRAGAGGGRGAKKRRRTVCHGKWRLICFALVILWTVAALYFISSFTHSAAPPLPSAALASPPSTSLPTPPPPPLPPAPRSPSPPPPAPTSYSDGSATITALLSSVKDAAQHAWRGYSTHALAHDEIRPSTNATNDSWGGFGVTAIDALDTLWMLGLQQVMRQGERDCEIVTTRQEFNQASLIAAAADWSANDYEASFFETTISPLRPDALLIAAAKLVELLLPALNTPSSLPLSVVNLKTSAARSPKWTRGCCVLAEAGSVQLEWLSLQDAILRADPSTAAAAVAAASAGCASMRSLHTLDALAQSTGSALLPTLVDTSNGKGCNKDYTVGALADSYYEYLLKAAAAIEKQLVRQTAGGMWYISESSGGKLTHRMDHLACFWPGTLALAAMSLSDTTGDNNDSTAAQAAAYLDLAQRLASTCVQLAIQSPSGLAPETVSFHPSAASGDPQFSVVSPGYNLRPEILESLFYLWRATKDEKYRQWGAEIWQAISVACRTQSAFSSVADVQLTAPKHSNSMPSYFLAETVKYAWLLFSDDSVLNLSENVLSTEAHPLPLLQKRVVCGRGHEDAAWEERGADDGDASGSREDAAADAASVAAAAADNAEGGMREDGSSESNERRRQQRE